MPFDLDAYLGIEPQALALQSRRMQVIADNLANVDTPNYKARDIDFRAALAAAAGGAGNTAAGGTAVGSAAAGGTAAGGAAGAVAPVTLEATNPRDIGASAGLGDGTSETAGAGTGAYLKYRVPLAPSLDGNTVDSELEQAAFAETSVRYQATLTFLSTSLRNLMTAITGS